MSFHLFAGGDEGSASYTAAAAQPDTDSEESRDGAEDRKRAISGRSPLCFTSLWTQFFDFIYHKS